MGLFFAIGFTLLVGMNLIPGPLSMSYAYEVWITDQSDTGKESGGFLYISIYDGAQLAANPTGAKPAITIDLAGEINTFCQKATKKTTRRPHMRCSSQKTNRTPSSHS